jgi:hypothetical protein
LLVRALVSFASVVFAMLASLKLSPPQSAGVDRIDESAIRALRRASTSTRLSHASRASSSRRAPSGSVVNAVNHRKVPI